MFRSITRLESTSLQVLGERLLSAHQDPAAAILCLDHAFNNSLKIQHDKGSAAVSTLRAFLMYCQQLQQITSKPYPGQDVNLQHLFGFRPVEGSENTYTLASGTFLHRYHFRRTGATSSDESQELVRNEWDLAKLLKDAVDERLKQRVNSEDLQCGKARAIFPCPTFVVLGVCNANDCARVHWTDVDINTEEYQTRIRLVFQQIMIYQTVYSLENRPAFSARRR